MTSPPLLIDGRELFDDAVVRFAAAVSEDRLEDAERFAALAFYLVEHRVEVRLR
jgi:hypothetical protein